jgi:mRNA interferase RelE/StbE
LSKYTVIIVPAVRRKLKRLSKIEKLRILKKIESLGDDPRPRGYKQLEGYKGIYRIRVGDRRIFYTVHDGQLVVTAADLIHRGDGYA